MLQYGAACNPRAETGQNLRAKKSPTDAGLFLQLACAENTLYTL
jgi:hypothetical protein